MFEEGFIRLNRLSLEKFGTNRKAAYKRRMVFDKLYLMAEFNPRNDGYGCLVTTISNLTHKVPILTQSEVRRGIEWLHENNFIHSERSSKYKNNGYLIKINHYEKLNKTKVIDNDDQLTINCQSTDEHMTNITIRDYEEKCVSEKTSVNQLTISCKGNDDTINQQKQQKEINTIADDIASVPPSKPKRTRSPSKPKEHTPAHKVWLAYAESYRTRYGDIPYRPRNAYVLINAMLEQVNEEDLANRVITYIDLNDSKLVKAKHPLSWLDNRMAEVIAAMSAPETMKFRSF